MQSPVALVALLRPSTRGDLLAAAAVSSLVFTATPFLLPAIADAYDVGIGVASLISSAQLAGFVLASSLGAVIVRPSKAVLVVAIVAAAVSQVMSAVAPWFGLLLAARVLSGAALGLIAWLGWQEVFGDSDRIGDLAVVGPVMGIAGAPLAAVAVEAGGADLVFVALAGVTLLPLALTRSSPQLGGAQGSQRRRRNRAVPQARLILGCLGLVTMGGSSVFVFAVAIGVERLGMSSLAVSMAVAANAMLGIPSARYRGERRWSGGWLVVTGILALAVTTVSIPAVFAAGIGLWGLAFWAGIPGVFNLLAEVSAHPADRAGDAQSVMAAGRVLGPIAGALLVEMGSYALVGVVAGSLMGFAGLTLVVIEYRSLAPTMGSSAAGAANR